MAEKERDLKEDIERMEWEFSMLYEVSNAMRTTLKLDQVLCSRDWGIILNRQPPGLQHFLNTKQSWQPLRRTTLKLHAKPCKNI